MPRFKEGAKKTRQVLFLADAQTFRELEALRIYKGKSKGWVLRMLIRTAHRRLMELGETDKPARMADLVEEPI